MEITDLIAVFITLAILAILGLLGKYGLDILDKLAVNKKKSNQSLKFDSR